MGHGYEAEWFRFTDFYNGVLETSKLVHIVIEILRELIPNKHDGS